MHDGIVLEYFKYGFMQLVEDVEKMKINLTKPEKGLYIHKTKNSKISFIIDRRYENFKMIRCVEYAPVDEIIIINNTLKIIYSILFDSNKLKIFTDKLQGMEPLGENQFPFANNIFKRMDDLIFQEYNIELSEERIKNPRGIKIEEITDSSVS